MVYLRAGYAPTDYPSEAEWGGRLTIERSNAAKCVTQPQQVVHESLADTTRAEDYIE